MSYMGKYFIWLPLDIRMKNTHLALTVFFPFPSLCKLGKEQKHKTQWSTRAYANFAIVKAGDIWK